MVRVHVDDIVISGGKNACENFFAQPKGRFSVKKKGTKDLHWLWFCSRLEIMRVRDEPDSICGKPGSAVWNLRDLKHPS